MWAKIYYRFILVAQISAISFANAQSVPVIDARSFFGPGVKCDKENPIIIETAPNAQLVFDARYNSDYILRGCSLYIKTSVLSLTGDVVIKAFDPDIQPLPRGPNLGMGTRGRDIFLCGGGGDCNGGDGQPGPSGEPGNTGFAAGLVTLNVLKVTGAGTLVIQNNGSTGGRGGFCYLILLLLK